MSTDYTYCCICKDKYNRNELYSCYNNHVFCPQCYKTEYYKGNERSCPKKHCYSWVNASHPVTCKCGVIKPKKMFSRPHVVSQKKKVSAQSSIISIYRGKSAKPQILSRRPVNCPHADCNKSVALSAFDAHFNYEHPKVQVIHTYLESRNGMELYLNTLSYNKKICIVRLNVLESGDTRNMIHFETRNGEIIKPSLVLLATRLPASLDPPPVSDDESEECSSTGDLSEEEIYPIGDKLLIWLASNIQTELSYTVAVSTSCNKIMMKHFGPMVAIDTDPKVLYMEGKAMVVAQHQLLGMTNNCQKHLVLNVIVHGKE